MVSANGLAIGADDIVIGIDLGTTNSAVGYWVIDVNGAGRVEMIQNQEGQRTTPSVVSIKKQNDNVLVGGPAKNLVVQNPENTLYDAKRLIGKKFNDPAVTKDQILWPFKIIEEEGTGRPLFRFETKKKGVQTMHPEEISAKVLSKLKDSAQDKVSKEVTKCVVTVPAYFNDQQRRATKEACALSQLECLYILNEPTAAAIACGLGFQSPNQPAERRILIFDFGGGTLDVTILRVEPNCFVTLATSGDCSLGGQDIDNALVTHFLK